MSLKPVTHTFLQSVLQNGIGRYVCQLQRVTLQFSKSAGSSRGVRDYIEEDVVDFASKNPQVVLYVTPHNKYKSPKIVAEFLNGNVRKVDLTMKNREEIKEAMELLRTQSGVEILKIIKPYRTQHPSVQGTWTPFTHTSTELNLETFPTDNPTKGRVSVPSSKKMMTPELTEELQRLREGKERNYESTES